MKTKLALLTLLTLSTQAWSGAGGGNGGVIVKCDNQIELADFYEAKVLHKNDRNFELMTSPVEMEDQIKKSFIILENYRASQEIGLTADDLFKEYKKIASAGRFIQESDVYWKFSNDLGVFKKLPSNCKLDNVIHYFTDRIVDIREDFYNQLTVSERAALWVHEVLYKRIRERGEKTSHIARRLTALLFSNINDDAVASGLILLYLSDKSVLPVGSDENVEFKLNYARPSSDNRSKSYSFTSRLNPKVVCKEIDRTPRILGKKTVCETQEENQTDYNVFEVKGVFYGVSGTYVQYDISFSLFNSDRVLLNDKLEIRETTGEGSDAGINAFQMTKKYYLVFEDKIYNYVFGRN